MHIVVSLVYLVLTIGLLVDIISRDDSQVKHLPKVAWAIIVALVPLLGGALWLVLGREWSGGSPRAAMDLRQQRRSQPAPRPASAVDTRSTEQQLADLEAEIAFYERLEAREDNDRR
ncbi:PLD nuclease N-terminal domain-containing protein [Arenivirga flava]|uniref:Cardiolipin synthase N-terminal domain-containing protein n=1 Tax=Arenivirga flava TaxID=1930060 RepID=A0AA37UKM8_9MICO|nr:PLD nuclease N-terminal domain-containing protein [Arenivirga flava]GMA29468.1 hypothetical protein GCM10025874_27210 [Arenivirga flava]